MSDTTPTPVYQVKILWALVAGFIGAVVTVYNLVQIWRGDRNTVTWIAAILGYLVILVAVSHVAFSSEVTEIAIPDKPSRRVRTQRYRRLYKPARVGLVVCIVLPVYLSLRYGSAWGIFPRESSSATPATTAAPILTRESSFTSAPTATVTPTATWTATLTVTATDTPTPTATSTDTPVPTPAITSTPIGGGGQITFVSDRNGHRNIYTMNPDGSTVYLEVGGINDLGWPSWSPDGQHLVYVNNYSNGGYGQAIVISNPDGTDPVEITNLMGTRAFAHPVWSPTVDEILFNVLYYQGSRPLNYVFAIRSDGAKWYGIQRPDDVGNQRGGVWSPDGQHILFYFANPEFTRSDIYVYRRFDALLTQLTNFGDLATDPALSPDGKTIAFSRNGDIWLMDANGLYPKQLTTNPAIEAVPVWSSDGRLIAFQGKQTGNWDIYVVPANGSSLPVNITNDPATDEQPAWRP